MSLQTIWAVTLSIFWYPKVSDNMIGLIGLGVRSYIYVTIGGFFNITFSIMRHTKQFNQMSWELRLRGFQPCIICMAQMQEFWKI